MNFDSEKAERTIIKLLDESGPIGMGFLTKVGFITATHVLPKMPDHKDPGSDPVRVKIRNYLGLESEALVFGADPCLDVAILSHEDALGTNAINSMEYVELLRKTEEADLYLKEIPCNSKFEAYIFDHEGNWVKGTIEIINSFAPGALLCFSDQNYRIKPGTSGALVFEKNDATSSC